MYHITRKKTKHYPNLYHTQTHTLLEREREREWLMDTKYCRSIGCQTSGESYHIQVNLPIHHIQKNMTILLTRYAGEDKIQFISLCNLAPMTMSSFLNTVSILEERLPATFGLQN